MVKNSSLKRDTRALAKFLGVSYTSAMNRLLGEDAEEWREVARQARVGEKKGEG